MWIALIVAAIEAAQKYYENHNTEKWQESVSNKLDEILQRLGEIDDFLKSLPEIIIRDMKDVTRLRWTSEIKARITDINDLISLSPKGPSSLEEQQQWVTKFVETKTLIEEILTIPTGDSNSLLSSQPVWQRYRDSLHSIRINRCLNY